MATSAQKEAALKSWIRSVSGYDVNHVILRNAGGPTPTGDYAVFDRPYNVAGTGADFVSEETVDNGALTRVHTSVFEARVGVDIYSENGAEVLEDLKLSVATAAQRVTLAAGDLTFLRRTPIIYVPEYGDTDPRDRYRAEFYFYTQKDLVETDYELQKLTATVEFKDDADRTRTGGVSVGEIEE